MMPQSGATAVLGYNTGQAWLSLMSIITTVLVWGRATFADCRFVALAEKT